MPFIERGVPVVDLSADFRLRRVDEYERYYKVTHPAPQLLADAVYGVPELHRDEIARTKLVATPGCHSTGVILALAPAFAAGIIERDVIADTKTGLSGAGRGLGLNVHFSEADESVAAYALDGHRHLPEMTQELGALAEAPAPRITFVPHYIPMTRGILSTCYAQSRRNARRALGARRRALSCYGCTASSMPMRRSCTSRRRRLRPNTSPARTTPSCIRLSTSTAGASSCRARSTTLARARRARRCSA